MIYFTSDFHFMHDREFVWGARGFKNVHEMNDIIINNFNKTIKWDDELYILGDIMLCDNVAGIRCLNQIPGIKHIIRGNHDTEKRLQLYNNCWDIIEIGEGKFFKYGKYHFYLSHYPTLCSNADSDKPLKAQMINLCGHSHTKNKFNDIDKGIIYHVEVDAHECKPVSIDTIIEDIITEKEKKE